ncbi:MAG: hypothetical protein R3B97_00350 [Dehalococcoidia bacterium]|nr:hypothetical protein [Dehalococcoidia bacterium]MCB9485330.1 hypothetical protein [Thermoflexaceae bacterium]
MTRLLFFAITLLAPISVACAMPAASATPPSQTPTPTNAPPPLTEPPPAVLIYGTTVVEGAAGTRCWVNVCLDYVGPVTPEAPLSVEAGRGFTLNFAAGDPTETAVSWYAVSGPPAAARNGQRLWSIAPTASRPVSVVEIPAEPGQYVLSVFARWEGRGDVSYGWYLEVK